MIEKVCLEYYRFSFNGQEKSPEISDGHQTALFWEYDSRSVHRWNVDPRPNTSISPYAIMQGNPIRFADPLGDTIIPVGSSQNKMDINKSLEYVEQKVSDLYNYIQKMKLHEGKVVMPEDEGYDNAQFINVFLKIENIDGIPKSKEEKELHGTYSSRSDAHLHGKTHTNTLRYSTNQLTTLDGILHVKSNGEWIPLLDEQTAIILNNNIDIQLQANSIIIYLDDFINFSDSQFNGQDYERGRTITHELGHVESILTDYLSTLFFQTYYSNSGGHHPKDPSGANADKREKEYTKSKN